MLLIVRLYTNLITEAVVRDVARSESWKNLYEANCWLRRDTNIMWPYHGPVCWL